jgi:hypothetical protein
MREEGEEARENDLEIRENPGYVPLQGEVSVK